MKLTKIKLQSVLFIDIETVPMVQDYEALPEKIKKHWNRKAEIIKKSDTDTAVSLFNRAGIYAEFGKIICISVGFIKTTQQKNQIRIKSFSGDDEKLILEEFIALLREHYNKKEHVLCAHNGKEFDFPYLARRILINNLEIPDILDITLKKPWEIPHLDTMELWKFGDYKNYTSLELLADIFHIPSPKNDISGADIARVYWQDKDLTRIVKYCQNDVLAVIQLFLKYQGKDTIPEKDILFI